jgi:class 3 adenylate cyclase
MENFSAAIMFADISGFTALTERLAQRGPAGIEELTGHLSAYFSPIVELIYDYGGDVIKFAGDALLVAWPATTAPLATVTQAAAQCSLKILADLRHYVVDDIHFNLHIGIAAGEVVGLHVGGVMGRWEFLIAGDPLRQIASATASAKSGEVYVSAAAWSLIQGSCRETALPPGDVRLDAIVNYYPPLALSG